MTAEAPEKYRQIAGELRARIESGEFAPGDRLPSLAALKRQYGVSDGPVNQAMRLLRGAGLVRSEQGRGSFALKPPDPGPSQYDVVMGRLDELDDRVRRLEATQAREREP
jgi:DNA-binding GntR family transcriptional regulator